MAYTRTGELVSVALKAADRGIRVEFNVWEGSDMSLVLLIETNSVCQCLKTSAPHVLDPDQSGSIRFCPTF